MREAYSLLRQSIIHVEQDDIDFDEEELQGERDGDRARKEDGDLDADGEADVEMTEEQPESLDDMGASLSGPKSESHGGPMTSPTRAGGSGAQLAPSSQPQPATFAPPKRKLKITHDRYMTLQSLIVLHLSATERATGQGTDRDELVDWYLELRESEMQDVEELEYEKELIGKVLRKLVKVSHDVTRWLKGGGSSLRVFTGQLSH